MARSPGCCDGNRDDDCGHRGQGIARGEQEPPFALARWLRRDRCGGIHIGDTSRRARRSASPRAGEAELGIWLTRYASARRLILSNSVWSIAPLSSHSFARLISAAAPPPSLVTLRMRSSTAASLDSIALLRRSAMCLP